MAEEAPGSAARRIRAGGRGGGGVGKGSLGRFWQGRRGQRDLTGGGAVVALVSKRNKRSSLQNAHFLELNAAERGEVLEPAGPIHGLELSRSNHWTQTAKGGSVVVLHMFKCAHISGKGALNESFLNTPLR